jgi:hypothetical protein
MPSENPKDAGSIPATSTSYSQQQCWQETLFGGLLPRQDTRWAHHDCQSARGGEWLQRNAAAESSSGADGLPGSFVTPNCIQPDRFPGLS